MQKHTDKLQEVRTAIDYWRKTKSYKGEPMPDHLWQKAAELLEWFTAGRVAVTLRVNINKLKKEFNKLGKEPAMAPPQLAAEVRIKADPLPKANDRSIEVTRVDLVQGASTPPIEPIRVSINKGGLHFDLTLPAGHDPAMISSLMNQLVQGVAK